MGKRLAERLEDDDYFTEPNYDQLTDEQLDELYNFGEVRSPSKRSKAKRKASTRKVSPRLFDEDEENWLDVDLEGDEDLYDDD